jgi:hypothetical protein
VRRCFSVSKRQSKRQSSLFFDSNYKSSIFKSQSIEMQFFRSLKFKKQLRDEKFRSKFEVISKILIFHSLLFANFQLNLTISTILPVQTVEGIAETLAVLRVELAVPSPKQLDLFVFLWQQRIVHKLLVIPHHHVAFNLQRLSESLQVQ